MKAANIKIERLINPVGVDFQRPEISWICDGGLTQTAYRVKGKRDGVTVFDSGRVESSDMHVTYKPKLNSNTGSAEELRQRGETIVKTLKSFGVGTRIVDICQSPSVTRFELQPDPGVKISKITALADDIAMNLIHFHPP